MDIVCAQCSTVLGAVENHRRPSAYLCKDCGMRKLSPIIEWLHFPKHLGNATIFTPVPDFDVIVREPIGEIKKERDTTVILELWTPGEKSSVMLMGQPVAPLKGGRARFTGLYIRATGSFQFKATSVDNIEPAFSSIFEVK
ncbi:MAG: hypothetical protein ACYDHY_07500 [Acidiferrobacterales bacterium]